MQTQSKLRNNGDTHLFEIEFFINQAESYHSRVIYGPLDFLGEVGGLADALIAIGYFLVTILQFIFGNEMSTHLLTHIFEKDNSHRNTELSRRN